MTLNNYRSAVPVIGTADVAGTVAYFEQTLGFKPQWIWGEPPVYAGVKAGSAMLYISCDPELAAAIREQCLTPDIFLWVSDIGKIYEEHRARHADIREELTERPWGVRQYVNREPNGYHLKIAEPLEAENA